MIRKVKGGYVVVSHDGKKRLSKVHKNRAAAVKRLMEIEYWKHKANGM